ncbi:MAG: hypothetical protein U9R34_05385, partial [Nanoarchaeota archaeon]|nr:hypothetical protein [Nanoarchaeota archaeon]
MKLEDILNDHHLNSQFSKVINSPFIDSEDTKKKYISKLEDFESEEIADILDFSKCFFNHKDMESVIIGHPFILDYFKGYYNCYKLAPTKFKDQSVNIMVNLSKNLHSFKLRSDSGLSFFESSLSVLKDPFEDPDLFHNPKDIEIYFNLLEQYSKEGVLPLAKGLMGNITVYLNNGYNYATLDKLVNNIGQIEKRASSTVSFAFLNGISTLALPIFYQDCGSKFKNIFNREMMDIYFNKINEFSTCSENQAFVFARDFPSVAQFKNKFIEHYIKMMEYLRDNGYEIIESSSPFP